MAKSEEAPQPLAGVTRALTLLTDLLQQPDPDASQISGHMDYLKHKETALSQLDDVILATTDEENLDQEVQKLHLQHDNAQFHVSALEGLGVSPDQYTVVLNRVLMRCLPEDLAIIYRQKTKETNCAPSIAESPEDRTRLAKEMLTFLRIQLEIREEGRQLSRRALQDEPRTHMPEEIYGAEPIPSASALTGSNLPVRLACPLCQSKDHMIAFCNANLSAEEKRARLQYANCCFRCGTRNHIARLCRKSINLRCGTCHRRHLTILCELSRPAEDLQSSGGSPAFHEPPPQPMRNVTTAQSSHVDSTPVLLQTGRVWADQFGASPVTLEALTIPEICSVTSPPLEPNILHLLGEREYNVADSFQPTTWQPEEISVLIGALLVSSSNSSAVDLDVPSMWCLDAIGIDGAHSQTLEGNHHLFGSELGISKRTKNRQVDNAVTSGRKVEEGDTAGEHVDAHLGRARRRQNGGDAALAQLALPKAKRAARRNSCAVCRLRKPAQERFDRTTQMERKHGVHECKGRNSSFDGHVNAMEDDLAQVNDLDHVPLFELLPISGEDTFVVSLDESNEASKLLLSTLGLEGTCMELLQQSFPKTTESMSQRKRMPLEELESVEKMFESVNQPFHTLPKLTETGNCQVLPNKNCEIGMDTNVVHVYEKNENAVDEKAMNSSYISLPQLINDLNNTGFMITDRPLKSSRYHWLSWKSIRPRRRLESKLDELQQLIPSQLLLGSRHTSVPQRTSASGLANAIPLQRKARQRLSTELRNRRQPAYLFLLRPRYHRSSCTMDACDSY
ncbi:hypothetical protein HPB52_000214 [Rhipicephalus sanguineus]|uniref:CCHC-type domain-containing protein n=1 Tax=Rhipicephalus sanguineus TaxID=34632 RepID=A0A9D4QGG7_RHISA|nr:hypothetical protein HPB52_000214 [Rhipicephalus sanguineus]